MVPSLSHPFLTAEKMTGHLYSYLGGKMEEFTHCSKINSAKLSHVPSSLSQYSNGISCFKYKYCTKSSVSILCNCSRSIARGSGKCYRNRTNWFSAIRVPSWVSLHLDILLALDLSYNCLLNHFRLLGYTLNNAHHGS